MLERLLHLKLHFYMIFFDSKVLQIELSQTENNQKAVTFGLLQFLLKTLPWENSLPEKKQPNNFIITPVNHLKKGTILENS